MSHDESECEVVPEEWHDGPMDWPDVPMIQHALDTWASGARIDFDLSEDLFHQLLGCDANDDDYFSFQDGKVRWKDMPASSPAERKQLAAWQADGNLDFSIKLSRAARWYCFANIYTACSLPAWVPKLLEAANWNAARDVLEVALEEAYDALTIAAQAFAHTPRKPAKAYGAARALEQQARGRVSAIKACIEALAQALRDTQSPPGVGVIVQVQGRDAIPVRALPYVTAWALSPAILAKLLRNTSDLWRSPSGDRPRSPWLTAYQLQPNGECPAVHPNEWALVDDAVDGFDSELEKDQHDHRDGYAKWRLHTMGLFPRGYFVWRDELEDRIYCTQKWNRLVWLGEDGSGSGKLNYAPMLLDGMREMVMAGFEEPAGHAGDLEPIEPSHAKTRSSEVPEGDVRKRERAQGRLTDAAISGLGISLEKIKPAMVIGWLLACPEGEAKRLRYDVKNGSVFFKDPEENVREFTHSMAQNRLKYRRKPQKKGNKGG